MAALGLWVHKTIISDFLTQLSLCLEHSPVSPEMIPSPFHLHLVSSFFLRLLFVPGKSSKLLLAWAWGMVSVTTK